MTLLHWIITIVGAATVSRWFMRLIIILDKED